jgi:hypothetical protein
VNQPRLADTSATAIAPHSLRVLTIEHFPLYRFLIPYQIAGVGAIFNRWSGLAFWPAIRDGFRPRSEPWRCKAQTTVALLRPST